MNIYNEFKLKYPLKLNICIAKLSFTSIKPHSRYCFSQRWSLIHIYSTNCPEQHTAVDLNVGPAALRRASLRVFHIVVVVIGWAGTAQKTPTKEQQPSGTPANVE